MIIFGVLLLGLVVGIGLIFTYAWDDLGVGLSIFCGFCLIFGFAIIMPLEHMEVHEKIVKFHATAETVERAREGGETWELAAFQSEIASSNRWLVGIQYYNSTLFDIWIPDEVDTLSPIE